MPFILAVYMIIKGLVNIIQAIYFFTRLQNTTEIDATFSLPSDPVIASYLTPSIINHKNFTMDYREAYYKAQDNTLKC